MKAYQQSVHFGLFKNLFCFLLSELNLPGIESKTLTFVLILMTLRALTVFPYRFFEGYIGKSPVFSLPDNCNCKRCLHRGFIKAGESFASVCRLK